MHRGPDGALPPVNAFSNADELNGLLSAALAAGAIARDGTRACLYFYPMSPSEPEPLLAVDCGEDPALLGHPLKLRECDGESPVDFTLRLLEDITSEANALAQARGGDTRPGQGARWSEERPRHRPHGQRPLPDSEALDTLAAKLNEPGECNGGDLVELVSTLLLRTGRRVEDEPDDEGIWS